MQRAVAAADTIDKSASSSPNSESPKSVIPNANRASGGGGGNVASDALMNLRELLMQPDIYPFWARQ